MTSDLLGSKFVVPGNDLVLLGNGADETLTACSDEE